MILVDVVFALLGIVIFGRNIKKIETAMARDLIRLFWIAVGLMCMSFAFSNILTRWGI